jgi:hypothetical protein
MTSKPDGTSCNDGLASTSGDRCVTGQCRGTAPVEPVPPSLSLSQVNPTAVPGFSFHRVSLAGNGFAPGMKLSFRSRTGTLAPWVQRVDVQSGQKGSALILAYPRRTAQTWDAIVTLPDGRTARLAKALRTDP